MSTATGRMMRMKIGDKLALMKESERKNAESIRKHLDMAA